MASIVCIILVLILAGALAQESYQRDALNQHNSYRARHGSPAMTLDDTLNNNAVSCAKYYAGKGTIDHSCPDKNGAGENLGWRMSSAGSPPLGSATKPTIDSWYDEKKDYNYDSPSRSRGVTGHFTQVVWMESRRLGCGAYQDQASKRTYVCCLYDPPGNWNGDDNYRRNVQRPR